MLLLQVDRVIFCLFLPVDVGLYEKHLQYYFPVTVDDDPSKRRASDGNKCRHKVAQYVIDDIAPTMFVSCVGVVKCRNCIMTICILFWHKSRFCS